MSRTCSSVTQGLIIGVKLALDARTLWPGHLPGRSITEPWIKFGKLAAARAASIDVGTFNTYREDLI